MELEDLRVLKYGCPCPRVAAAGYMTTLVLPCAMCVCTYKGLYYTHAHPRTHAARTQSLSYSFTRFLSLSLSLCFFVFLSLSRSLFFPLLPLGSLKVYKCVYIHVCMYVCMHVCMYVSMSKIMYVCKYVDRHRHRDGEIRACRYTHTPTQAQICT